MAIISNDVENFKYLGSFVQNNWGFDMDVKHRIKCNLIKWRQVSIILCNKRISMWQKVNFTGV
jgi:hypothetical protein